MLQTGIDRTLAPVKWNELLAYSALIGISGMKYDFTISVRYSQCGKFVDRN